MLIKRKWLLLAASLCFSGLHAADDNAAEYPDHYAERPTSKQVKTYITEIEEGVRRQVTQLPQDFKFDWLEIGYAPERLSPVMGALLLIHFEYENQESYAAALRQKMAEHGFVMDEDKLEAAKLDHTHVRLREGWYTKPALEHWDRATEIRQNPAWALLQALHDVARCEKGDGNAEGNPWALDKKDVLEAAGTQLQGLLDGLKQQEEASRVLPINSEESSMCANKILLTCVVVPVLAMLYTYWSQA